MYIFGLLLGHEPRLVDRRRCDDCTDGRGGDGTTNGAASTLGPDDSAGDTGSFITCDTPIDQLPVVHLHSGGGRRLGQRHRSRSQTPRRDRLSLWSRLMCQPEVFDPHVEASPMSYLMEMHSSNGSGGVAVVTSPLALQESQQQQQRHMQQQMEMTTSVDDVAIVYSTAASSEVLTPDDEAHRDESTAAGAVEAVGQSSSLTKASTSTSHTSSSGSSSDSQSQDPTSPVSSVEEFLVEVVEVGAEEPLDEAPPALSDSTVDGGSDAVPKPRRAFRVTDTRKCRCRLSRAAALHGDGASTGNTSFATSSCAVESNSSGIDTCAQSCTTTSTMATTTALSALPAERLISREALALKRVQRRQQTREAARRQRDYNAAWEALVKSQQRRLTGRAGARYPCHSGASATSSTMSREDGTQSCVIAATLTNDALEAHRERLEVPAYELPDDLLARMRHIKGTATAAVAAAATGSGEDATDASLTPISEKKTASPSVTNDSIEQQQQQQQQQQLADDDDVDKPDCDSISGGGSITSSDSGGVLVADDCLVSTSVEGLLPVMYSTMLRCSEATDRDSGAAAVTATTRGSRTGMLDKAASSTCSRAEGESVQRIPRGRYALGSRGYVEHVMFAQCRQQECALFSLLTEAHRQARAAHLRLSQVYYYYLLPVLAQHQEPQEVEGLVTSLLRCGSGALRAFHGDFCTTVPVESPPFYDPATGTYTSITLLQVQPVDYQLAQYRFENPWRELFHEIKGFLGMQAREDVSVETLSTYSFSEEADRNDVEGTSGSGGRPATMLPSRGTVCMAATVLHSMEIFERQRHALMATKDAEDWLAWYYYYLTPQLQQGSMAGMEVRRAVVRSLLPVDTAAKAEDAGAAPTAAASAAHVLEREYLPMVWGRACETARRESVLGFRRAQKLEVMAQATVALQAYVQAKHPVVEEAAPLSPLTVEAADSTCSPQLMAKEDVSDLLSNTKSESDMNAITSESASCVDTPADTTAQQKSSSKATTAVASAAAPPLAPLLGEDFVPAWLISPHTSPTTARLESHHSRMRSDFVVEDRDEMDEDEEEEIIAADAYQTVNVGCFGLSFFSFFD